MKYYKKVEKTSTCIIRITGIDTTGTLILYILNDLIVVAQEVLQGSQENEYVMRIIRIDD